MAGKNYAIDFTLHDPKTGTNTIKSVTFTAPEGPRGPKGDCRGVSVHKVSTLQDFATLYNSLSDTQKIIGMEAYAESTGIPVSQEYVFNVVDDYVSYYAIASGGAVKEFGFTLGDQGSFKIQTSSASGAENADYVNVYVYDSETPPETVNQAVFPSLAGPFKQGKVPAYPSLASIPTKATDVSSAFNLGAWDARPIAHRGDFVAFAFLGGHLNAITASYDFNINVWTWKEATPLSKGCQVVLEDSQEGHVYIVKLDAQANPVSICDVVKPIVGRIPLEFDATNSSSVIEFNQIDRVYATVYAGSDLTADIKFQISDICDCEIDLDTSRQSSSVSTSRCQWYFNNRNAGVLIPGFTSTDDASYKVTAFPSPNYVNKPFNAMSYGVYMNKVPKKDERPTTIYYPINKSDQTTDDGDQIWMNWKLAFTGYVPSVSGMVYAKEPPAAAASMPMMAKAMSIEPELTQEEFNEIIKDKKGIFTIKDGKVYDLLTGEYVN